MKTTKKIVLAFSGGLDTSWCVPWLKETYEAEIITVFVDVGGAGEAELKALADKSKILGADKHIHVDAREEYFSKVIRWLIAGHVMRGHLYPLCVGAERSLQAKIVAEMALAEGATSVAHGCTAAGNDQVRFEIAFRTLTPQLEILAPIRDGGPSRADEVAFLEERNLPVPPDAKDYSINSGLWGVTIGGKETCTTTDSIPESAWQRTRGAFDQMKTPTHLSIGFFAGMPVSLNGRILDPVPLIETLDAQAASFGIGRGIHLGDTILGVKGRVAFEAPAATVLIAAHRELEKLTLTSTQQSVKDHLSTQYGELVHTGRHLDPACRDMEALFEQSQRHVTGEVKVMLRTGMVFVEGAQSPFSLHDMAASIYGEEANDWTSNDAKGFCALAALPTKLAAQANGGTL
ncbi:MAG: argininosuccinate synthase [Planctomycetota bacterium]|jgi:argininosuccinate synthase